MVGVVEPAQRVEHQHRVAGVRCHPGRVLHRDHAVVGGQVQAGEVPVGGHDAREGRLVHRELDDLGTMAAVAFDGGAEPVDRPLGATPGDGHGHGRHDGDAHGWRVPRCASMRPEGYRRGASWSGHGRRSPAPGRPRCDLAPRPAHRRRGGGARAAPRRGWSPGGGAHRLRGELAGAGTPRLGGGRGGGGPVPSLPRPAGPPGLEPRSVCRRARWLAGRVDVVHGPNHVVPPGGGAAEVVTVHDLTATRYPELCTADVLQWPPLLHRALARGAWIHTVSETVAAEVRHEFPEAADRVVAAPNGIRRPPPPRRPATPPWASAWRAATATSSPWARWNLARSSRPWWRPSTPWPPRTPTSGSCSPGPTAGGSTPSPQPEIAATTAGASCAWAGWAATSASACSAAPRCSPTPAATRASAWCRSRRSRWAPRWWRRTSTCTARRWPTARSW